MKIVKICLFLEKLVQFIACWRDARDGSCPLMRSNLADEASARRRRRRVCRKLPRSRPLEAAYTGRSGRGMRVFLAHRIAAGQRKRSESHFCGIFVKVGRPRLADIVKASPMSVRFKSLTRLVAPAKITGFGFDALRPK